MVTQLNASGDSDLVRRVASDCDAMIDAELCRLRRRRPSLSDSELAAVDAALDALADRLLLTALRDKPDLHDSVAPIFAAHDNDITEAHHG